MAVTRALEMVVARAAAIEAAIEAAMARVMVMARALVCMRCIFPMVICCSEALTAIDQLPATSDTTWVHIGQLTTLGDCGASPHCLWEAGDGVIVLENEYAMCSDNTLHA